MKKLEEIRQIPGLRILYGDKSGFVGQLKFKNFQGSVVCSWARGWEHVSISHKNKAYLPSWDDMCALKDMFFKPDEWVVQFHPPVSEYVNNVPNCLHLWRPTKAVLPTPPSILTGVKGVVLDAQHKN